MTEAAPTDPNKIPVPAATVVLVRDATDGRPGVEVLLARRNSKIYFAGGAWVFPGGRIDAEDHGENYRGTLFDETDPQFLEVARRACVREAREEADAVISADDLVLLSHWMPPMEAPKRFSTFFFIGPAPTHDLTADGGEIHELAWMRPAEAVARRNADEIELIPPTFVTLALLDRFASATEAIEHHRTTAPDYFVTKFAKVDEVMVSMWEGDAGYESGDAGIPGARHRITMRPGAWTYERSTP